MMVCARARACACALEWFRAAPYETLWLATWWSGVGAWWWSGRERVRGDDGRARSKPWALWAGLRSGRAPRLCRLPEGSETVTALLAAGAARGRVLLTAPASADGRASSCSVFSGCELGSAPAR